MKLSQAAPVTLLTISLLQGLACAQVVAEAPATSALRADVEYLAGPETEGRMTGTAGATKAAEYLVNELKTAGYQPGGENGTYLQKFEFSAGVKPLPASNKLEFSVNDGESTTTAELGKDFMPLGFTSNETTSGEVVFAGYGLRAPGTDNGYDSYAGLDVKDKIVLVLRYVPEEVSQERRAELNRYAGLRYKAMLAREHGARALIVVSGPNSPGDGELVSIQADAGNSGSGIPAISVTSETASLLFAAAGKDLKEVQSALDTENPHAESGFTLSKVSVNVGTGVERLHKPDNNVIGVLPPTGGSKEYIVLGAHYDHLGYGEAGAMKRKGEEDKIHFGADDNASGCGVVMEMARQLAEMQKDADSSKPRRGVIVGFWSGEEVGIIGSSHYADNPTFPMEDTVAYINFDMVGRLRDNKLNIQGVGSSPAWTKLAERFNVMAGFSLNLQEDPYLPTDATAFYPKGVPVLNFFTGSHEDYHRPTDTVDKLDFEGMDRIAEFAAKIANAVVTDEKRPEYVKVEKKQDGAGRDALRVYIGSIPDYTQDVPGVKLSGTRAGSPADKAGIQAGDIITEFAGQKITNIYDYTYALDAAKIGQPLNVVIDRSGTSMTLVVTPEARK